MSSRSKKRAGSPLRRRRGVCCQWISARSIHLLADQPAHRPVRGAIGNRARLLTEVIEAVCEVWGPDRVGMRMSPPGVFNDIGDDDPETTFGYLAEKLNDYALAYLSIMNPAAAAIGKGMEPDLAASS